MSSGIRAGKAFIDLLLNTGALKAQARGLRSTLSAAFGGAGLAAGFVGGVAAFAGVSLAIKDVISNTADMTETLNRTRAILKDLAPATEEWARELSKLTGRSRGDLLDSVATFTSVGLAIGKSREEAAAMAQAITKLAVDFSSFNNTPLDEVVNRFRSAILGSNVVLDQFGIILKGVGSGMDTAASATARLAAITEQLGKQGVLGDAARTAREGANAFVSFKTAMEELSLVAGERVLPSLTKLLSVMTDLTNAFFPAAGSVDALIQKIAKLEKQRKESLALGSVFTARTGQIDKELEAARKELEKLTQRQTNEAQKAQDILAPAAVLPDNSIFSTLTRSLIGVSKDFGKSLAEEIGSAPGRAKFAFNLAKTLREDFAPLEEEIKRVSQPLRFSGLATFTGREAAQTFDPLITVQREQIREQQKTTNGITRLQNLTTDVIRAIELGLGFR